MLKNNNDYLDRTYSEATLGDHLDYQLRLQQEKSAWSRAARDFLAADDEEIYSQSATLVPYEVPNLHRGLRKAFPDWTLCCERGLWSQQAGTVHPPNYRVIETSPGRRQSFLAEGSMYYQASAGNRRIVTIVEQHRYRGVTVEFRLVGQRSQRQQIQREFQQLVRSMRQVHYLRRQAINPSGKLLTATEPVDWHDLALPAASKDLLRRNTLGILDQRKTFRKNRVPLRRGVLLYGPPGTGKTLIGKLLARLKVATFLWITSADIDNEADNIRQAFKLARELRPTIVFLEDIDLYATDRQYGARQVLGELLCQMDGLEKNDGLILIATTNDLDVIAGGAESSAKPLTVKQAAERLGVSVDAVYDLCRDGRLRCYRAGEGRGTIRIRPSDLHRFQIEAA